MSPRSVRIWRWPLLGAVVIAAIIRLGGAGHAQTREVRKSDFLAYGVAGITAGQIARLHAVSIGNPELEPVELTFHDSQGIVLRRSSISLVPGQSTFLDLRILDAPLGAGTRLEFYAVVRFRELRQGYVVPTLEVINSETGQTINFISDPMG